jgi:hypothetical protein
MVAVMTKAGINNATERKAREKRDGSNSFRSSSTTTIRTRQIVINGRGEIRRTRKLSQVDITLNIEGLVTKNSHSKK